MLQIFKKNKKGFTLVELLVVIAIIGMLSSIVLVSLGGVRSKARDAKRQSDMQNIVTAQNLYYNDNEGYAAITDGATPPGRITTTAIGTYLDPIPLDPGGGAVANCNNTKDAAYVGFTSADKAAEYCVWACLETGKIFAASEKGTKTLDTAPTAATCW